MLVTFNGAAMFGELAIVRWLEVDGWQGAWLDTFHGRKAWNAMPNVSSPIALPDDAQELYDRITRENGGRASGAFDVMAWRDGKTVFLEYEEPGDRPNRNQLGWISAALDAGVSGNDLLIVAGQAGDRTENSHMPDDDAAPDPFDLARFVLAQDATYDSALAELTRGRKTSHWMWYVFPQVEGLGSSFMSRRYAIRGSDEARAYLHHAVLGPRLTDCCDALLALTGPSAHDIFGSPDDRKLHSSATLFTHVSPAGSVFHRVLDRYFGGVPDAATLQRLRE